MSDQWIPIEKLRPEVGVEVLILGWVNNEPGTKRFQAVAAMDEDGEFWEADEGQDQDSLTKYWAPTHWAPLLELPLEERQ